MIVNFGLLNCYVFPSISDLLYIIVGFIEINPMNELATSTRLTVLRAVTDLTVLRIVTDLLGFRAF